MSVNVCLSFQMLTSVRKIHAKMEAAAQICEQTTPASVPANTWGGTVSTVSVNRLCLHVHYQTMASLEEQTQTGFGVCWFGDGSQLPSTAFWENLNE